MTEKTEIKSLYFNELESFVTNELSQPRFRASQLFSWMHEKKAAGFEEMTNLPAALRERLGELCDYTSLSIHTVQTSAKDGTKKYAFVLADGNIIESVYMRYAHGNSVCISSQVGCRMGCRFCASTIDGLVRNLTASEMLEQVYEIERDTGTRVSNVVIMGSGEPLDNYENTVRFIRLISDQRGCGMSQRNITLSTCGIVPRIRDLAMEDLAITLAISLHAPTDELRRKTMPIANSYSISEILEACGFYFEKTGRRISFEYSVIRDLNDGRETIEQLAALLKGRNCHVNLISVNPIKERDYRAVDSLSLDQIKNILEKSSINVTIRRRLGGDIDSACGQLRRKVVSEGTQFEGIRGH